MRGLSGLIAESLPGVPRAGLPPVLFLLFCLVALVVFGVLQPRPFFAWLRNLRGERLLHYVAMLALGVYMSDPPAYSPTVLVAAGVSVTLAWAAAVVNNDLVDYGIDRISNPGRPLPTGVWSRRQYAWLGLVTAVLALAGALCVNGLFAICVLASLATAFVYSTPPLRLRRYLVLSSALIALASFSIAAAGFVCCGHRALADFPPLIGALLLVGLTCGANFKDVKDYEGDRTEGIQTLVTLLGPRRGQIAAGMLVAGAIACAPLILRRTDLIVPSAACAGVALGIAISRRFREKLMLLTYFAYLLILLRAGIFRTP